MISGRRADQALTLTSIFGEELLDLGAVAARRGGAELGEPRQACLLGGLLEAEHRPQVQGLDPAGLTEEGGEVSASLTAAGSFVSREGCRDTVWVGPIHLIVGLRLLLPLGQQRRVTLKALEGFGPLGLDQSQLGHHANVATDWRVDDVVIHRIAQWCGAAWHDRLTLAWRRVKRSRLCRRNRANVDSFFFRVGFLVGVVPERKLQLLVEPISLS